MFKNGPGFAKIHNLLKSQCHRYAPCFIRHMRQVYHGFQCFQVFFGTIPISGKFELENINILYELYWARILEKSENKALSDIT